MGIVGTFRPAAAARSRSRIDAPSLLRADAAVAAPARPGRGLDRAAMAPDARMSDPRAPAAPSSTDADAPPAANPGAVDPFAPRPHPLLTWVAVVCGTLALMFVGADLGPRAFFMGVGLAVVPVPVYLALAL